MRKAFILVIAGLGFAAAAAAQDQATAFDARRARVQRSERGRALTDASRQGSAAVVAQFLRSQGRGALTLASLREIVHQRSAKTGITHVRMQQEVGGLRLAGAYLKAALDDRGRLVNLIDNLADLRGRPLAPARVDEARALRVALAVAHPDFRGEPAAVGHEGTATLFDAGTFFDSSPRVERVAIAMKSGAVEAGFEVETWTAKGNLLFETLVGGDGRVLSVEPRTNTDSYNVFAVDPGVSPQGVVAGPGAGNAESPAGWLTRFGQKDIYIHGNNVKAYLDTNANNRKDPGGVAIHDGNFLAAANLSETPASTSNRAVAVQNLFYLNNVLHDELYKHGFDEAAGNFQQKNFGLGGSEKDPVRAEAQDGSGTDNANFATPPDGRKPRMQMYVWTGKGVNQVVVNTPSSATYRAQGADFGPDLTTTGLTGDVVLVNDGTGPSSTDACEAVTNSLTGKIALVDRGTCNFTVKVKNAQNAGAIAAIVANNVNDSIIQMGGADATITIPSVFIGLTDGNSLRGSLPANATARLTDPPPLQRDGDVDSDIVFHEYGHGLTTRMIGGMSGPMSGAIGEGMSDVLAVILNENDVVGEYSFDDVKGIRSEPYDNYSRTYGDIAPGNEVHFDGEVYGAIGWRLLKNFQAAGIAKDLLLDDIVDGMNFTPAGPAFEDMRDGILQSVAINNPTHECLVWEAFAHYGVGEGASSTVSGGTITVNESFVLPAQCTGG